MDALVTFFHSRELSTHLAIRSDSFIRFESIVSVRFTSFDSHRVDGIWMIHFFRVFALLLQYFHTSPSTRLVIMGNISIHGFCIFSPRCVWLHFLPIFSLILALYASTVSRLDSDIFGYLSLVIVSSMVSSSGFSPIMVTIP